jgi:SP family general alpha glucoside:H+ symporter-like MFS transporter
MSTEQPVLEQRASVPAQDEHDDKHGVQTPALSENEKAINEMFANAASATDKEHNMTLRQGLKLYPKAIAWSALISTLCAMEGYDISLIGNFCESQVLFWFVSEGVMS